MTASILVATPHAAFGELLRLSLEDSGQYQVHLVQSGGEARAALDQGAFQLAILDSALKDEPFVPFCMDLLGGQSGIRLVVIPPDNNPNHPSLGGLIPHGYLSRPFYLPDLLDTVARLLNERKAELIQKGTVPAAAGASATLPPWLQEPLTLTKYLASELAGTQAEAGVVGLHGPDPGAGALRAFAGTITGEAAQELATTVFRYWDRQERADLMRFIRLAASKKDYLVYATQISGDLLLILAFDSGAPLSQIRPQTKALAQTLVGLPPEGYRRPAAPIPAGAEQPENPYPQEHQHLAPAADQAGAGEEAREPDVINLSALLGVIPPPDPDHGKTMTGGWYPDNEAPAQEQAPSREPSPVREPSGEPAAEEAPEPAPEPASLPFTGQPARTETPQPVESIPYAWAGRRPDSPRQASVSEPAGPHPTGQAAGAGPEQPGPELEEQADGAALALDLEAEPPVDPLEDTRPRVISTLTHLGQLEPVSPAISLLNYTCVLVPRLPQHYLTGELADRLSQWVAQLCLAFGWRLEGIAVRPDYLLWTVQVAPAVSPGNLVRILRQRTSLHIFSAFPQLAEQNPSGDFWATGYLIVSGPQPPSAQLLRDYITQTRKRQGIIK